MEQPSHNPEDPLFGSNLTNPYADSEASTPSSPEPAPESELKEWLSQVQVGMKEVSASSEVGTVRAVVGTIVRASLDTLELGELCRLENNGEHFLDAEVVGFDSDGALLTPLGTLQGLSRKTKVLPPGSSHKIPVGDEILGKVLDGLGRPIDGKENDLALTEKYPVNRLPPAALDRKIIEVPLSMGVKAIDGMLTCGEGQRVGIFAGAGVGKSTLLAQIIRSSASDVVVLGLIGERGREVREFIEKDIGPEAMKRTVVVVATSERPPMEKLKAAQVATTVAEYFRDQGKKVLLLVDSLTRFARAQREVGLAAGESPTGRGYPPSVFAALPQLLERAGQSDKGSITAMYTVLMEGDDLADPIADEAMSLLDGHIVLSRELAGSGHYPAIDILKSVSRVMPSVAGPNHVKAAALLRDWLSKNVPPTAIWCPLKLRRYPTSDASSD